MAVIYYLQVDRNDAFSVCRKSESPGSRLSCVDLYGGEKSQDHLLWEGEKKQAWTVGGTETGGSYSIGYDWDFPSEVS